MADPRQYPYQDGDITVLGPETFVSNDGQTISWKGDNYTRQTSPAYDGPPSAVPPMRGPSLRYTGAPHEGTQTSLRVDMHALDDPRERAICRALLHHALALLDATEPPRKVVLGGESRRV
ncbi:hypothetical protein AB0G67_40320 [Streptomyces sp. NPDC021056]|uniref:hypothetical protein n=1 Tax=Streptomyces sp. NPDC021056 TaxID=3155012 RepID=UPI0033C5AC61